jgi:hypothetical protein
LADKLALDTSRQNLHKIALDIVEIVRPDIYNNLVRLNLWRRALSRAVPGAASAKELHPGPILHETLPDQLLTRIKPIHAILWDVIGQSFEDMVDAFKRDAHPMDEIAIWEKICIAYLAATRDKQLTKEQRKAVLNTLPFSSTQQV